MVDYVYSHTDSDGVMHMRPAGKSRQRATPRSSQRKPDDLMGWQEGDPVTFWLIMKSLLVCTFYIGGSLVLLFKVWIVLSALLG